MVWSDMSHKNEDADLEQIATLLKRIEQLDARIGKRCALGLNTASLLERRKTLVSEWALVVASSNVTIRHVPFLEDEDVQFDTQEAKSLRSWEEVEISFLSDERIEICVGGKHRSTHNYGELGFEDRRTGRPNLAWVMLRELAKERGTIQQPQAGQYRVMVQKRIEEIREKLRNHFEIAGDPIPFNGSTYQSGFAISCRKSFDT
jgi:hypothetical protein